MSGVKRQNLELMGMKVKKKRERMLSLRDHWPFWVANSAMKVLYSMKLKFRDKGQQRYIRWFDKKSC